MNPALPIAIPMTSLVASVVIFFLPEGMRGTRTFFNLSSALLKVALVALLGWGVYKGEVYRASMPLFLGFRIVLHADPMSLLFVALSAVLWLVTTVYAVGYLDVEGGHNRSRFFGFFGLCVSATTGIALAGNLVTYLVFYELLTITTYPLVVHRGTGEAIRAGRIYLAYTLSGGAVLLVAIIWLKSIVGAEDFVQGGMVRPYVAEYGTSLRVIFALLVLGFGVKAALVPLHGWLPVAMVAPAPVSALLHAVAVVKAGAFGIVRTVYDVFGVEVCSELGVRGWLAAAAAFTILYGSLRALSQDDLKRRLAFSTVSQLSYITLGVAILGPTATVGGIVHLIHQGIMKITMFFTAGSLAEELHIKNVSNMDGTGYRMPFTMTSFTVAAFGMIGVPPLAGFVSKWYLATGSIEAGALWVVPVLLISTILNACYFLPIIYRAWFKAPAEAFSRASHALRLEADPWLVLPAVFTALCVVLAGLFAASPFSPLHWARLTMFREYGF